VAMAVLTLVPIAYSVYIAFTNYSTRHLLDYRWIGLRNFQRILVGVERANFISVLTWTLEWALVTTVGSYCVGLFLALLLNNPRIHERNVYRTILIYPWTLPATLTVMVWAGLLNTSFGPVNQMLQALHLRPVPWLTDPTWARVACVLVQLWLAYPFVMSVFLGALQSIDPALYEAAAIDGASDRAAFRHITLPLLRRATLPLVIASFAMNLNGFGVIYLLTGGGPITSVDPTAPGATDLLGTYMYKLAFGAGVTKSYGQAAATGIIIFFFVGGLTLLNSLLTGAFAEVEA
ncbi:MAG: sugar ABC transporter permease, partial [Anaerolineae bacterium]|nr:sugar ABC transporter permease [Anaerolineae bacterium]